MLRIAKLNHLATENGTEFRLRVRVDGRPWRVVYQLRMRQREVVMTRVVPRDTGASREMGERG